MTTPQDLLLIAAEYAQAGKDIDGAVVLGIEVEDRRPALAEKWAAGLTEFVDSRIGSKLDDSVR